MILKQDIEQGGVCGFFGYKFKEKKLLIHTIEPTDPNNDYPHLIFFTPRAQPRTEGPYFILTLAGYHYSNYLNGELKHFYRMLNQVTGTWKTPEPSRELKND